MLDSITQYMIQSQSSKIAEFLWNWFDYFNGGHCYDYNFVKHPVVTIKWRSLLGVQFCDAYNSGNHD